MALGLRKSKASVGAGLAYWLGNPILNPATMVFMGFVIGWQWVALRVVMAVTLVFVVAYLANYFVRPEEVAGQVEELLAREKAQGSAEGSIWLRWLKEIWRLAVGLIPEYVVLVLLLGAARAWLFPGVISHVGNSFPWIMAMAIAGMLFVIPTAGEIPIVQTLMSFGLGAGPAGALLTTLPPVSLPSLVMVGKAFPLRVLLFISLVVVVLGVLTGLLAIGLRF